MTSPELLVSELRNLTQQNPMEARRQLARARAANPHNPDLEDEHIRALLRDYDMRAVVRATRAALATRRTPTLLFWLGGTLMHLGRPRAALAPLTEAARDPQPRHLDMLARCQHRVGQLADAIMTLSHLISLPEEGLTPFHAGLRGLAGAMGDAGCSREADSVMADLRRRHAAEPGRVAFAMVMFDSAHPFPGWRRFLDKGSLARTLAADAARHPGLPPVAPETFRLPDEFAALAAWHAAHPGAILAIKPTNLYGGHGVVFTRELPSTGSGGCVAQRMVDPPCLIEGRKFHIRLYLVVTAGGGLLWREGIVRLAPEPYATDAAGLARAAAHVTNTALHAGHPGLAVSSDPWAEDTGHVRTLSGVLHRLPEGVMPRLRALAGRLIRCAGDEGVFRGQAGHLPGCFPPVLFGLDVLLGEDGRPWLLEVQYNPALGGNPLVRRVHAALFDAVFALSTGGVPAGFDDLSVGPARLPRVTLR